MSEKVVDQFKNLIGGMSLAKKISILVLLAVTVSGFVFIMTWAGAPNYKALYSGLNPEDAGSVVSFLQENNVAYKIGTYGNTILVPEENVHELRMQLAARGLPQGGGIGFEIFDDTKIGMTEFSQNINFQRALQGELSRTINGFDEVEKSRIHIVMASKSLFAEKEEPASASVVVKLYQGRKLSNSKVQSIVHLLSSAISGLDPENVTVVDNNGNMLTRINKGDSFEGSSDDQLAYQAKIERNLENSVKSMLETALGKAKATVRISCAMDFQKLEKTQEMYLPENRVIRSEQRFNELSSDQDTLAAGIPGVTENSLDSATNALEAGTKGYQKNDQTINYEIGKVVSHIVEPVGKLQRLSIAVIVDGTYRENEDEEGNVTREYVPRTPDEMTKLKNIVKTAVNFDENRGDILEIVNLPFEGAKDDFIQDVATETGWLAMVLKYSVYLKYAMAVLFIFMLFLFVVKPIVAWLTGSASENRELIPELPKRLNEIENGMAGGTNQLSFQNRASQMISSDQNSVDLLREWLTQA